MIAIAPEVEARLAAPLVLVERRLGKVHESWLDALEPRMRGALVAPARTPADVWLANWALADLPVA
ncbi:MAG TPA: hypothetical protein VL326_24515, partial [Kofleriaceae bacterium]|nr:hypothetical protein [Kofleriaceae bacterium]